MIVALVACSASKLATPARARDLYVSDLFRKARAFAERFDAWAVLSAKHRVVFPDTVLEPYDVRMPTTWKARLDWVVNTHCQLHSAFPDATRFVFLAGAAYACHVANHNGSRCELGADFPLAGLGIGARLAWLKAKAA